MRAIDGGYLSWIYGSDPKRWFSYQAKMNIFRDRLLLMDASGENLRSIDYPAYKGQRLEKRSQSDEAQYRWLCVKRFRDCLELDPRIRFVMAEGLEADDLIALVAWIHGIDDLYGQDKDLLQLEGLRYIRNKDGMPVGLDHIAGKLPKGLYLDDFTDSQEIIDRIPLLLAMFGDSSDNIPRVVPKNAIKGAREVVHSPNPYWNAYGEYGPAFLDSLWLTVLPYPGVFYGITRQLLPILLDGGFWRPDYLLPELDKPLFWFIRELDNREEYPARYNYLEDWRGRNGCLEPTGDLGCRAKEAVEASIAGCWG
jgi:hypothetical protein